MQGLRALGYVEGQNLILERRSAEGRYERFGDIVAELVRLKVDVIVTVSTRGASSQGGDHYRPHRHGNQRRSRGRRVRSEPRATRRQHHGAHVAFGPEIEAKRLELLGEMLPGVSRSPISAARKTKTGTAHSGRAFGRLRRPWA